MLEACGTGLRLAALDDDDRDTLVSDQLKRAAAERAAALVTDGMRLGIGTGSTAALFVRALGERVRAGLKVVGVPTSEATRDAGDRARAFR